MPVEGRSRPATVAEHLVKQGKLSRFQARKLLRGTCVGLVLGAFQVLAPIGRQQTLVDSRCGWMSLKAASFSLL